MTASDRYEAFAGEVRAAVEQQLAVCFAQCPDGEVSRAAQYATLGGGRRWRAVATVAAGRIFDPGALRVCLPQACSIELVYAATLMLDDLPSMDNATVRRGKPCPHLVFPAWVIDMAPAFLVNMAYGILLRNPHAAPERRLAAAMALGEAGHRLSRGQEMDLSAPFEGRGAADPVECCRLKTGALFAAAIVSGGLLCGCDREAAAALHECGMALGVAYQLQDDAADAVADAAAGAAIAADNPAIGKKRSSAVAHFGMEQTKRLASEFAARSLAALNRFGPDADTLRALVSQATGVGDHFANCAERGT